VTEKFYKIFDYDMIPVVYGKANYSQMAPAKSYINAQDYESAEKLADYLNYLDKNETAFAEYFEWKRYFQVNYFSRVFCNLCQALNDQSMPKKVYTNIDQWWVQEANCSGQERQIEENILQNKKFSSKFLY
jgi:hypothetical protein